MCEPKSVLQQPHNLLIYVQSAGIAQVSSVKCERGIGCEAMYGLTRPASLSMCLSPNASAAQTRQLAWPQQTSAWESLGRGTASVRYYSEDTACLANHTDIIEHGFHILPNLAGTFDPNAVGTIAAFHTAKFDVADVYMFPCSFRSAQAQINELIGNLTASNVAYGRIWCEPT